MDALFRREGCVLQDADYEEIERRIIAHTVMAAEAWRQTWFNACPCCHGWGGFAGRQGHPYGSTVAYEETFDVCDELPVTQCHRCGEHGLDQDSNGPCTYCGWNYDDGEPTLW